MIDPKVRREAKRRYLDGDSPKTIAADLEISYNTLKQWISKGTAHAPAWKGIKEAHGDRMTEIIEDPHIEANLKDAYSAGMNILARSLVALDASGKNLTAPEIDRLVAAMDRLDKWQKGQGAEDDEFARISLKESMEKVKEHPFLADGL